MTSCTFGKNKRKILNKNKTVWKNTDNILTNN